MDDSPYPLAQADHAFAYEGAYRTPNAMSAATREAYGMRGGSEADWPSDFRVAMRAAASQSRGAAAVPASRRGPNSSLNHANQACTGARKGLPQAAPDRARFLACARARNQPGPTRPPTFYYVFTSAAGCAVRAIA